MKKLLFAIPLMLVGCQAFTDATKAAKDTLLAPPSFVMDAIHAILQFLGNAVAAFADMFLHKFLPF